MKKVIGIFLIMVFMFVVSMALAEDPKGLGSSTVHTMLMDWMSSQKIEGYNHVVENGVYYGKGVIDNQNFKDVTGDDFTIERLRKLYFETDEIDVTECEVRIIGFIEGYNVYEMKLQANTPLGNENGEDYFKVKMIFMVSFD